MEKKEKTDRPPCPECGAPNPISSGRKWLCRECGRQWLKIKRPRKTPPQDGRPLCPYCGSVPISNGLCWYCKKCGKQWKKVSSPKSPPPDFFDRRRCPECGGIPASSGNSWRCTSCGRIWRKVYRCRILEGGIINPVVEAL